MFRTRTLMIGVLILFALGAIDASAEPGSRRFDRFTFFNVSAVPVDDVRFTLYDQNGELYGGCPPVGYGAGPCGAGQGLVLLLDQEVPGKWVTRVVCTVRWTEGEYQGMRGNEVQVSPVESLTEATFTFSQPMPPDGLVMGEGLTGDGFSVPGAPF